MVFPYLNFQGDCEEAFNLYERAFEGENKLAVPYGEAAPSPDEKDLIMHIEMDLGDYGRISGADALHPQKMGTNTATMVRTNEKNLRKAWAVLQEEGIVVAPLEAFEQGNGLLLGTIKDKFGFVWIFSQDNA